MRPRKERVLSKYGPSMAAQLYRFPGLHAARLRFKAKIQEVGTSCYLQPDTVTQRRAYESEDAL